MIIARSFAGGFKNIRDWRRRFSKERGLPVRKELKGQKLASGRGRYRLGRHQFARKEASGIGRDYGLREEEITAAIVYERAA